MVTKYIIPSNIEIITYTTDSRKAIKAITKKEIIFFDTNLVLTPLITLKIFDLKMTEFMKKNKLYVFKTESRVYIIPYHKVKIEKIN